jgi:hypothetical protein
MSQHPTGGGDRRRSPRFSCGGQAQVSRLPSDGIFLPAKIRDLSVGGCGIDFSHPIDCGGRTEIVVRVNAASFRVVGEVKAMRGQSGACVEFLQVSRSGKDKLEELLAELEQMQKLEHKLKGTHRDMDSEVFRQELKEGRLDTETQTEKGTGTGTLSQRLLFMETFFPAETLTLEDGSDPRPTASAKKILVSDELRVTQVDLFG